MSKVVAEEDLLSIRHYFNGGETRSYAFRKRQLVRLKEAVLKYENEIHRALYSDLKKSPEEAYVTETGLILAEIDRTLKQLHRWMAARRVSTNLVNLPSTSKVYRDPLGVVLIIAPFNFPVQLLLKPLIGAIAGGNCAVLKPSELTPASSAVMAKMIAEIFPSSYIKLVEGDGAVLVPGMMNAFRFDHIFYTGSTRVGKIIYQQAASQLITVTLELGGKSPCIVEKDANLAVAARRIVSGKFTNAGQTCIAPDYLLVHESCKSELQHQLKECIEKFYSAHPSSSHDYGKIISEAQFERLVKLLQEGKIYYGGEHNREALFISPTLIDDVSLDHQIMKEEIFGPILPMLTFNTREEAMSIIGTNPDPLALYLFTTNKEQERFWIERLSFGGGCINNTDWHFTNPNLPFGGVAYSGIGSYHGKYSFDTFTREKAVMKTPNWFDPAIKYPPLKGKLGLLKRFIR